MYSNTLFCTTNHQVGERAERRPYVQARKQASRKADILNVSILDIHSHWKPLCAITKRHSLVVDEGISDKKKRGGPTRVLRVWLSTISTPLAWKEEQRIAIWLAGQGRAG